MQANRRGAARRRVKPDYLNAGGGQAERLGSDRRPHEVHADHLLIRIQDRLVAGVVGLAQNIRLAVVGPLQSMERKITQ